jgi:hypothetical protein
MIQNVVDFIQNRLPRILDFGDGAPTTPSYTSAGRTATFPGITLYDYTTLTIYGSGSSKIYKPVNRYTQSQFNNDVQVVSIELGYTDERIAENSRAILILLRFGVTSEDSELSVTLQDNGAKEKAMMIVDQLLRVLEANKNMNGVFYPNEFVPTLVFVVGFIIGLSGLMFENKIMKSLCIIIFGAAIYFVAHRFTKGYCSFDSKHQNRLNLFFKWLTRAVVLFVIIMILRFGWKAIMGG